MVLNLRDSAKRLPGALDDVETLLAEVERLTDIIQRARALPIVYTDQDEYVRCDDLDFILDEIGIPAPPT
jgi:hypothetical protein